MEDLITDYTALGVKAAGLINRLLNGTGEVITHCKIERGNSYTRIV
jgi:hypothetical protein